MQLAAVNIRAALQSSRPCTGRRAFAGRQLRAAVGNGSRCRAFFKFGGKKDEAGSRGAPADAGGNRSGRIVCGLRCARCCL